MEKIGVGRYRRAHLICIGSTQGGRMPDGNMGLKDETLEQMSLRELLELQETLHKAIRAEIRKKNEAMAAASRPPARQEAEPRPAPVDLERERDAWLAAKRRGS
jgi:hypothetical protein